MPSRGRRTTVRRGLGAVRGPALALLALGAGASCAHHIGKKASQGAIDTLKENPPEKQPMRVAGGRVVAGALEELETPEQQRRMHELVTRAVEAAVAGSFTALDDPRQQERMRDLVTSVVDETVSSTFHSLAAAGDDDRGPAAVLAGEIARAATRDAMREVMVGLGTSLEEVFPGCSGPDAEACRRDRLRALTREAGAGFSTGVLEAVRWPLLFGTGLFGLVVGLVVHWLWTLRARPSPGGHAPTSEPGGRGSLRAIAESRAP